LVERNSLLPTLYDAESNFSIEAMRFYFKEKWVKDIHDKFKNGYLEMSQINLILAEIGIEEDMRDLTLYEARLLGRELL
jgi:CopG family transcriptional regulator/antitoxin EndoAI